MQERAFCDTRELFSDELFGRIFEFFDKNILIKVSKVDNRWKKLSKSKIKSG